MRLMSLLIFSLASFFLFYSSSARAIGKFEKLDLYPGVTPVPIVFDYSTCTARYQYCSCRLTGLENADEVLERFDEDEDGKLSYAEMHLAINAKVFSDEELGDTKFLACWFDPPSPGPYSRERCHALFGEDDCVCAQRWPQGYYCFSRSAVMLSPDQVPVPRQFCKTVNGHPETTGGIEGEGFDCRCPETFSSPVMDTPQAERCYIVPPDAEVDYECFDEIRIFPGDLYVCVDSASGIQNFIYEHCCPDDIECALKEYNAGFDYLGASLFVTNVALKFYTAWRGYSAVWGEIGTLGGFIQHIAGDPTEILKTVKALGGLPAGDVLSALPGMDKFLSSASSFEIYSSLGQAVMGTSFTSLASAVHYAGLAYTAFSVARNYLRKWCTESDYALACKVRARLCINVGRCKRKKFLGSIKKEVWICYNSQIARVINEYGLPQLYDPGCHAENCSAASVNRKREVERTNCGCEKAYTTDFDKCKYSRLKERVRYKGFTPEEFERLDFDKIPLAEELAELLLAKNEDFVQGAIDPSTVWQDPESQVNKFSAFETENLESSAEEQTETAESLGDTGDGSGEKIGSCPSTFPITASQVETYSPSGEFMVAPCVKPRMDYGGDPELEDDLKVRRFYLYLLPVGQACFECAQAGIDPMSDSCADCREAAHHYECIPVSRMLGLSDKIALMGPVFTQEISVSPIWACVDVKHFKDGGFYVHGGMPPLPPPRSWSEFAFFESTPASPEQFSLFKLNKVLDPNAFAIVFVNSLSVTGMERGKFLKASAGCLFYKDRLGDPPCTHMDCGRFVAGEEDMVSPACLAWINNVHNAFYARVDEHCNVVPESGHNMWGKKWLRIENFSALALLGSFTAGKDYFCSCPSYQDDICLVEKGELPEMVCPRPSRVNLVERMLINLKNGGLHATYINTPEYRSHYCWLDPLVAGNCPCN